MSFGSIIHDMVIDMNETRLNAASQNGAPLGRTTDDPYTSHTPLIPPVLVPRLLCVALLWQSSIPCSPRSPTAGSQK